MSGGLGLSTSALSRPFFTVASKALARGRRRGRGREPLARRREIYRVEGHRVRGGIFWNTIVAAVGDRRELLNIGRRGGSGGRGKRRADGLDPVGDFGNRLTSDYEAVIAENDDVRFFRRSFQDRFCKRKPRLLVGNKHARNAGAKPKPFGDERFAVGLDRKSNCIHAVDMHDDRPWRDRVNARFNRGPEPRRTAFRVDEIDRRRGARIAVGDRLAQGLQENRRHDVFGEGLGEPSSRRLDPHDAVTLE